MGDTSSPEHEAALQLERRLRNLHQIALRLRAAATIADTNADFLTAEDRVEAVADLIKSCISFDDLLFEHMVAEYR